MNQSPSERRIDPDDPDTFFYQSGSYTPDRSIGFLMRRVLSSVLQLADAQLSEHGLTYVQWLPLYKLMLCAEANSSTLAKDLGMDPASVTRALDRIEAKGLLRRERSTTDRRVVHLVLTDAGRHVATQVPQVLTRVLNGHLQGFSHAECTLMLSLLQRMLANGDALRDAWHPSKEARPDPSP